LSEQRHAFVVEVLYVNVFGNHTSDRVDDRTISHFFVELRVFIEPFVGVNLKECLHQKLGPEFQNVNCAGENWPSIVVARHAVINFNEAFFTHHSQFDPVFTRRRQDGSAIFLRIDTLPNLFFRFTIDHASVFAELELRGNPLSVERHAETEVQAVFYRYFYHMGLVTLIFFFTSFSSWLLSGFLVSFCFSFFGCFTCLNFFFGFKAFLRLNETGLDLNFFFFDFHANVLVSKGLICF
jgi:hypothetical protein